MRSNYASIIEAHGGYIKPTSKQRTKVKQKYVIVQKPSNSSTNCPALSLPCVPLPSPGVEKLVLYFSDTAWYGNTSSVSPSRLLRPVLNMLLLCVSVAVAASLGG